VILNQDGRWSLTIGNTHAATSEPVPTTMHASAMTIDLAYPRRSFDLWIESIWAGGLPGSNAAISRALLATQRAHLSS